MKSLGIPSRVGGRSSGPLVRWSCHQISTPRPTKSCTCHQLYTSTSKTPAPATKSALQGHKVLHLPRNRACHEICTPRPTKSCTCHEICTSRSTKKSCACHEICAPRPIKSCAYHWPPTLHFNMCIARSTKYCACHKTLRLPLRYCCYYSPVATLTHTAIWNIFCFFKYFLMSVEYFLLMR